MKKVLFSLFYVLIACQVFGQDLEISSVIPSKPIGVTKHANINSLTTSVSYIGTFANDNINPYQSMGIRLTGSGNKNIQKIYSGRNLDLINAQLDTIGIFGGDFMLRSQPGTKLDITTIETGSINSLQFKYDGSVQDFALSQDASNYAKISGREINVNSQTITSPREVGNTIFNRQQKAGVEEAQNSQYGKVILGPWSALDNRVPTVTDTVVCMSGNTCSDSGCTPGTGMRCALSNPPAYCFQYRSVNLPELFEDHGETYEKIGSIRVFCQRTNNACQRTSSLQLFDDCSGVSCNIADYIEPSSFYAFVRKSTSSKCQSVCNNSACSGTTIKHIAVNRKTGNTGLAADLNAACTESDWGLPSGLTCKADENVYDVYRLTCYKDSGKLLRQKGIWFQQRKVMCRKYDQVHEEYDHLSSQTPVNSGYFIYADFN